MIIGLIAVSIGSRVFLDTFRRPEMVDAELPVLAVRLVFSFLVITAGTIRFAESFGPLM